MNERTLIERIRDLEKHLSVQDAYIDTLEAENARLRAEVERLEDRLNDEDVQSTELLTEKCDVLDCYHHGCQHLPGCAGNVQSNEVSFDDDDIYDGVKTDTTGVSRYEILLLTTIFLGVLMSIYGVAQIG